jgi:hypothetical protein
MMLSKMQNLTVTVLNTLPTSNQNKQAAFLLHQATEHAL